GTDAGFADAAGTVRRGRGRERAGTAGPLLAAELAVRVLVVRDVVLEGSVVEHVGLRLGGIAVAGDRPPAGARHLPADGAEARHRDRRDRHLGDGHRPFLVYGVDPKAREIDGARAGRRVADRRDDVRRLRIGPEGRFGDEPDGAAA